MSAKRKRIILTGPPNSGKTSLFNWLTGFRHRVVNYPGSTVFLSVGRLLEKYGLLADVTDSPGIYSLFPQSEDEKITVQALFRDKKPDAVILVLDEGKLEIQLPLLFQLKEAGFPVLTALTMRDTVPHGALVDTDFLSQELKSPVTPVQGLTGKGMYELIQLLKGSLPESPSKQKKRDSPKNQLARFFSKKNRKWDPTRLGGALARSKNLVSRAKKAPKKAGAGDPKDNPFYSHRWDRLFLHPQKGLLLFAGIMMALFYSIFWLAAPFMTAVDGLFSFLTGQTVEKLSKWPRLADFAGNGLLTSIGAVLIFVPQIFILFAGIALLEGSGYLARAVALMDGPLSKIGLTGRSFVPFLSGFACAIPAILSARNFRSRREKLMTFFAVPFMSCSARLPVYALLLSFLFYGQSAWKPGLSLALIYIGSFLLGAGAVAFLNLFLKKEDHDIFLLDLPLYRRPDFVKILRGAARRTKHYIVKAGPAVFTAALLIWLLTHLPLAPELSQSERIGQSYAGRMGRAIQPLFELMGVDWRVGLALIAAFAAREVFVSALILVFSIGRAPGGASLLESMQNAVFADGSPVFTTSSVSALTVFFMFSLQCLSTTAVVYKESGSLKLALSQLLTLNVLAWLMAVLTYQSLNFLL